MANGEPYPTDPTDLSDEQWELLRELVPAPKPSPGHEPISRREIVNGLLNVSRTGIQWRMMPHDRLNWSTVYEYFRQWRDNGVLDKIMEAHRPKARRAAGRGPSARLAIVDSQSARTTESGGPRGCDGDKKICGRKPHIVVDADGIPIVAAITTASTHDSRPAPALFREAKPVEPEFAEVFADSAYVGGPLQRAANDNGMELRIARRSAHAPAGCMIPCGHTATRSQPTGGRLNAIGCPILQRGDNQARDCCRRNPHASIVVDTTRFIGALSSSVRGPASGSSLVQRESEIGVR
jgi:putative transposase